jgi:hypothetical protein
MSWLRFVDVNIRRKQEEKMNLSSTEKVFSKHLNSGYPDI